MPRCRGFVSFANCRLSLAGLMDDAGLYSCSVNVTFLAASRQVLSLACSIGLDGMTIPVEPFPIFVISNSFHTVSGHVYFPLVQAIARGLILTGNRVIANNATVSTGALPSSGVRQITLPTFTHHSSSS